MPPSNTNLKQSPSGISGIVPNNSGRKILFSDKSESSVEELMGETPSNYNL